MLFDLIHHIDQVSSHFGQLAGLLQADFLRRHIQDKVALTEHSLSRFVVLKVGNLPGAQNGILITPDFQVSHVRFEPNDLGKLFTQGLHSVAFGNDSVDLEKRRTFDGVRQLHAHIGSH